VKLKLGKTGFEPMTSAIPAPVGMKNASEYMKLHLFELLRKL